MKKSIFLLTVLASFCSYANYQKVEYAKELKPKNYELYMSKIMKDDVSCEYDLKLYENNENMLYKFLYYKDEVTGEPIKITKKYMGLLCDNIGEDIVFIRDINFVYSFYNNWKEEYETSKIIKEFKPYNDFIGEYINEKK